MSSAEPDSQPTKPPRILAVLIPLVLIGGGLGYYFARTEAHSSSLTLPEQLRAVALDPVHLDPRFSDPDNLLTAHAPPADRSIKPATLVFMTLGTDQKHEEQVWAKFLDHLAARTGYPRNKIVLRVGGYQDRQALRKLPDGGLQAGKRPDEWTPHILALSTGNTPLAVNVGGFVPFCTMAEDSSIFGYSMKFIVPAGSPIHTLAQCRGRTIGLGNLESLSGCKLPLTLLWEHGRMAIDRDFQAVYLGSHRAAVEAVRKKEVDFAPVASDLLDRYVAEGVIRREEFREIPVRDRANDAGFVPFCFGRVYNLDPDLASKIEAAFLTPEFEFDKALHDEFAPAGKTRFVRVHYREDWKLVREVDARFRKMILE